MTAITTNTLQGFLSPEGQQDIMAALSGAPAAQQEQMLQSFFGFIETLKDALAGSISSVFFFSVFLMAAATRRMASTRRSRP